ncbi:MULTISPECIES: hypothetical protein [unclassified Streptomyces]|uniref:hypothetical protein n=1 Tax=unclassified Streptomyces TaxID=2593676 RepID=UPI001319DDCB|nr:MULTISPECIES: hypothetical protein [unclassified Streptomyces]MYT32311.1 hypothetical protein [Streptomyces sp. SID8354]
MNPVNLYVRPQSITFATPPTPPSGTLTITIGNFSSTPTTSPVQVTVVLPPYVRWNGVNPHGITITNVFVYSNPAAPQILRYNDPTMLKSGGTQEHSVAIGVTVSLPTNGAVPDLWPYGVVNALPTGNDSDTNLSRNIKTYSAEAPPLPVTPPPGSNLVDLYFLHRTSTLVGTNPDTTEFDLYNNLGETTANALFFYVAGPFYTITALPPNGSLIHTHRDFGDYDIALAQVPPPLPPLPPLLQSVAVRFGIQANTYTGPDGQMHSGPDGPRDALAIIVSTGNDFDTNTNDSSRVASMTALNQSS